VEMVILMDVIYQGLLPSRATFDTPPVARQIIPGLEKALTGMQPGTKQQSMVPADQAYGP
jgi:FKBP-type peptidyl-prolyl cis-trans isomerase